MSIQLQAPALSPSHRYLAVVLLKLRRFINRSVANMLASRERAVMRLMLPHRASPTSPANAERLSPAEDTRRSHLPNPKEDPMHSLPKSKTFKSKTFKSKITAAAIAMIGTMMVSLAPASAATTVRDHRDKPVVNDHREGQPVVRDQRGDGAVTVRPSTTKRKPVDCLGNLCNVKKVCVGPACF